MKAQSSVWILLAIIFITIWSRESSAIPAFALKENLACVVCHTNGSAPHLTKFGYMYRRAGFRLPSDIGNAAADEKAMTFTKHFAAGLNADYEYVTNKAPGATSAVIQNNNFDAREIEVFPLVGSFFGNFGVFSELDFAPTVVGSAGGANLNHVDIRYVTGTPDFFFNLRAGLISQEGYGASDQSVDDGNIPLFDQLSAHYNQDTLVLPFGAMQNPQMGAEFGGNYLDSHLTLGIYNGFDGTNGLATNTQSTLVPGMVNQGASGSKDVKLQLDQFIGSGFEVTAAYYHGTLPLLDPTNQTMWTNHYSSERVYLTYSILPSQVDLLAGLAYGQFEYTQPGGSAATGTFDNRGTFFGANYYVMKHLTLCGRLDYYQYNISAGMQQQAAGATLMVSVPFDNNIFVFHYTNLGSDLTGITNDVRLEWRFLF